MNSFTHLHSFRTRIPPSGVTRRDATRREDDQHDRNASIILSVRIPTYEDVESAVREVEYAKDKRALADCLDFAG